MTDTLTRPTRTRSEVPERATPESRTRQERFELKYWVYESVAQRVVRSVAPYLAVDPFAAHLRSRTQSVTALYLDTPGLEFARLHVEKAADRFKLRVRAYGDPPAGPAFLEVKRKVKAVIEKRRAMVPLGAVPTLLDPASSWVPTLEDPAAQDNLHGFLNRMLLHRATPRVLIRYAREAYVADNPVEDVRVTLDRGVSAQPMHQANLLGAPGAWRTLPTPLRSVPGDPPVLLELKFRGTAPCWMRPLVQSLALRRTGNSKYLAAIRATVPPWQDCPHWLTQELEQD